MACYRDNFTFTLLLSTLILLGKSQREVVIKSLHPLLSCGSLFKAALHTFACIPAPSFAMYFTDHVRALGHHM
jgi:hypothetical protein